MLGAELEGDGEVEIHRVARIEDAGSGELTFLANPRYHPFLISTQASAVIVARDVDASGVRSRSSPPALLKTDDPYLAFLRVMARFNPPSDPLPPGIHPTAVIETDSRIGEGVRIGAHAVISRRTVIGAGSVIGHGTVIGTDVVIGEQTLIYHNVTVREGTKIGARVIVHSGVTIGSDGFGFAPKADGSYEKIPQLGIVVLEDDVEIGANCTIDRATMGETRIRKGAKLDNLIQVAHNVVIGEDTVIAAQAGISGSTRIGKQSMIGGQVGITGHLSIAERTKIGAQSGLHRSVKETGQTLFGSPALPHREAFRVQGAITQLPELLETVRKLRQSVAALEERLSEIAGTMQKPNS
jgi:UDP-3-O-[3-hydroxymyristoyl] glucosamine N-acyltransferase